MAVKDLLVPKQKETMELWTRLLATRILQVHNMMGSMTLSSLEGFRIRYGGEDVACGDDLSQYPKVEVHIPIPRGVIGRPLLLEGLWHWTGDCYNTKSAPFTYIWGIDEGDETQLILAKVDLVLEPKLKILKVTMRRCDLKTICRKVMRAPAYFWGALGQDISLEVKARKVPYDEASGWETEMSDDNELLIAAGILNPLDLAGPESFPRMGRPFSR